MGPPNWSYSTGIRFWLRGLAAGAEESGWRDWAGREIDAEAALTRVREELQRLGGWAKFGEALHECTHLDDALQSLRRWLALVTPDSKLDSSTDSDGIR